VKQFNFFLENTNHLTQSFWKKIFGRAKNFVKLVFAANLYHWISRFLFMQLVFLNA